MNSARVTALVSGWAALAFVVFDQLLLLRDPAIRLFDPRASMWAELLLVPAWVAGALAVHALAARTPLRRAASPVVLAVAVPSAVALALAAMVLTGREALAVAMAAPVLVVVAALVLRWATRLELAPGRVLVLLVLPMVLVELLLGYGWLLRHELDVSWWAVALTTAALCLGGFGFYAWLSARWDGRRVVFALTPLALVLVATSLTRVATTPSYEKLDTPNVILIVVDTLRRDHVGLYGDRAKTPNIDRFFGEGIVFDDAWSTSSWTLPAMVSLFSEQLPQLDLEEHTNVLVVPESFETLPEALAAKGYATGAFADNAMLRIGTGLWHGFEERMLVSHCVRSGDLDQAPPILERVWNRVAAQVRTPGPFDETTDRVLERALRFMGKHRDVSFFVWVHLNNPHDPYQPSAERLLSHYTGRLHPKRFAPRHEWPTERDLREGRFAPTEHDKQHIAALYRAEVEDLDASLGQFFSAAGVSLDSGVVVLVSDHGEELWDHSGWGHGQTLATEVTAIPLMIKTPEVTPTTVTTITSLLALFHTLRPSLQMEHRGDAENEPNAVSVDYDKHLFALRNERETLFWNAHTGRATTHVRRDDPHELSPYPADDSHRAAVEATQRGLIEKARRSLPLWLERDVTEALRSLGYRD